MSDLDDQLKIAGLTPELFAYAVRTGALIPDGVATEVLPDGCIKIITRYRWAKPMQMIVLDCTVGTDDKIEEKS